MAAVVGNLLVRLQANTTAFKGAMAAAAGSISLVSKAAAASSAAIAAIGIISIKAAADFEKGMVRVAAVSNATAGEYVALEKAAMSMAASTQFSAIEVADGMSFLAMAGFSATEVIDAMPSALELASAGMIDLATASNIVTNVMAGMGLELEDLGRANDTIVSAITGSNVNVQMLGESFKFVGPVAKGAGIAFEEVTAALGILGNAGIQGSMAGTTLRGAITRLLAPSEQATKIMEEFGVEVFNADDSMKSLEEIIREVEFSGLAEGARGAGRMMEIFGLRAGPGMQALVDQGSDALGEFKKRLEGAAGTAKRISDMQLQTLTGKFDTMSSAIMNVVIDIGQRLIPMTKGLVDNIKDLANWLGSFSDDSKNAVISIGALTVGFTALSFAIGGIVALVKSAAFTAMLTSFSAMIIPVLAVAAAVIVTIAAIGKLSDMWKENGDKFKDYLKDVGNGARDTWAKIVSVISSSWKSAMKMTGKFFDFLDDNLFTPMRNFFVWLKGKSLGLSENQIRTDQADATKAGGLITSKENVAAAAKAADMIVAQLKAEMDALVFGAKKLGEGLGGDLEFAGNVIKDGATNFMDNLGKGLEATGLKDLWDRISNLAGKAGPPGGTGAKTKKEDTSEQKARQAATKARFEQVAKDTAVNKAISDKAAQDKEDLAAEEKAEGRRRAAGMRNIFSNLLSSMGKTGEIFSAAKQGFSEAGPWGALIGAILAVAKKTESFGSIIGVLDTVMDAIIPVVNDLLRPLAAFAPIIAMVVHMIFRLIPLFTGMTFATDAMVFVIESFVEFVSGAFKGMSIAINSVLRKMAKFARKFNMDGMSDRLLAAIIPWEDTLKNIEDGLKSPDTEIDANNNLADSANNAAAALNNVPSGFKVALERFEATLPDISETSLPDPPSGADANNDAGTGGDTINNSIILTGLGLDDAVEKIAELIRIKTFDNTGTTQTGASPFGVPQKL